MLRVALIGSGKIAKAHALQIRSVAGCELIAVCSRELQKAKDFSERYKIKDYFDDVATLVTKARPDAVHITTPPQSHFEIAKLCLELGCHVYVEKPFTLNAKQAETLLSLAEQKVRKLTVGHNQQFSTSTRRMRALIHGGYLGGSPVHMESHYGYDLGDPTYARAVLGDKNHWVRSLPGKLLHNIISHGIARIAEFLKSDDPQVFAFGLVSPFLKKMGESELMDELRVTICEQEQTTAYFTFSSQMRPLIHEFRIYGPENGLLLDQDHDVLIRLRGRKFKSYADTFIPPMLFAKQYFGNLIGNAGRFLARELHKNSGMEYLMKAFYRCIREDAPVPIPYHEILRTARIMDAIFEQLQACGSQSELAARARSVAVAGFQPRAAS